MRIALPTELGHGGVTVGLSFACCPTRKFPSHGLASVCLESKKQVFAGNTILPSSRIPVGFDRVSSGVTIISTIMLLVPTTWRARAVEVNAKFQGSVLVSDQGTVSRSLTVLVVMRKWLARDRIAATTPARVDRLLALYEAPRDARALDG